MSFQISDLFSNQNSVSGAGNRNTGVDGRVPVSGQQLPDANQSGSAGGKVLADFPPGSSLTGQVVTAKDGTVTIRLADSTMLSASLKGGISLMEGSQVTFVVNSNSNNQMTLSPLFTNLGTGLNVESALHAASLPVNAQTSEMVGAMMEQGMSIDKDSLPAMYKQIVDHPQVDVGVAVRLVQMNLAVNELNASQLQAYDNLNHQLSGSITEIANNLQQVFQAADGKNTESLIKLFDGIIDLLQPGSEGAEALQEGMQTAAGEAAHDNAGILQAGENGAAGGAETEVIGQNSGGQTISHLLSEQELQTLSNVLKDAGAGEELTEAVAKGEVPAKEALRFINDFMQGKGALQGENTLVFKDNTDNWKALLTNPAIGKLLQNALEKNWLLEPKDVADKEKVDAFYEQLKNQAGKMADMTSSVLGKDSSLYQNVNRLSQNIDFMNQLNQTFTYIQVPLKLSGQNANGDLYVYTNKKNLAKKNGSVSAFLHLDMDHLGSVDVYVAMENQRVSTNFKVRDDSILDLIEANIDLLNERLQKRGYTLHPTVEIHDEDVSVVEEMQKQMGQNTMPVAQYSFDARA